MIRSHNGMRFGFPDDNKLRAWQKPALEYACNFDSDDHRKLIQAPMGSGKSLVSTLAIFTWFLTGGGSRRAVYAAPSFYLAVQIFNIVRSQTNIPVFLDTGEQHAPSAARIVITTHARLQRWLPKTIDPNMLLIFDECHHDNWYAQANHKTTLQFAKVIGFSASPWSKHCEDYFQTKHVLSYGDALNQGVIAPFICYARQPEIEELAIKAIEYHPDIDVCDISYRMPQEANEYTIRMWQEGEINPIKVCGMLNEGIDSPDTIDVVLKRNTTSAIFMYQALGRALRFQEGKVARLWGVDEVNARTLRRAMRLAGYHNIIRIRQ